MAYPDISRHLNIERQPRANERLQTISPYRGVIILGPSGSGQSTAGKTVGIERLNVSPDHFYDAGEDLRLQTGNNRATTEYMRRGRKVDLGVDGKTASVLRSATTESPAVVVAKLGGYLARMEELQHLGRKEYFIVLLTCAPNEAARRIYRRKLGQIHENYDNASVALDEGRITIEEFTAIIEDLNVERLDMEDNKAGKIQEMIKDKLDKEARDREHWGRIYRYLKGVNVYDPDSRIWIPKNRRQGRAKGYAMELMPQKLWDAHFDTTYLTPYQTANRLVDTLIKNGVVRRIDLAPKPKSSDSNDDFPTTADIVVLDKVFGESQSN
jgi:shikimate kinase